MLMIEKSIVIAALARDCNESLIRNIPRIESLRSRFVRSQVVVIENDSKDDTKETLKQWAIRSPGVEAVINDFGTVTIPQVSTENKNPATSLHRIEKMACYRNMYMDYVRSLDWEPDYLIVVDVDVQDFSVEGIVTSIEKAPSDWGGLFANGNRYYCSKFPYFFDLYAYVPEGCENKPDQKQDELFFESKRITRRIRNQEYVSCLSAFGGVGVYKWGVIKDHNYRAQPNHRSRLFEAMCEHVPFNLTVVAQGYGCYVCRTMVVNYGSRSFKHLIISLLPNFVFRWGYRLKKGKRFAD
ncbi:MAG: glycosyltransferase [Rikenella sp.]|nr:glycosyltransferase [Rikenella sp.]